MKPYFKKEYEKIWKSLICSVGERDGDRRQAIRKNGNP